MKTYFKILFFGLMVSLLPLFTAKEKYSDSPGYDYVEEEIIPSKSKHAITDVTKRLRTGKGDLVNVKKGLGLRTADLTDVKAKLFRSIYPNKAEVALLKKDLIIQLNGTKNYLMAKKRAPKLVSARLKYTWDMVKEETGLLKRQKSLNAKGLSSERIKFIQGRIKSIQTTQIILAKKINALDKQLINAAKNGTLVKPNDYFNNRVTSASVDLINKLGEAKHRYKKGDKVLTKISQFDSKNYYQIKYKGEILYAMRKDFHLK